MSDLTLTKAHMIAGVWEGVLEGAGDTPPALQVTHMNEVLDPPALSADGDVWRVRVTVPPDRISDGVQTFVVATSDGTVLESFAVVVGEPLGHDIRAEVDLLRAELDMLKTAFRRHCVETAAD